MPALICWVNDKIIAFTCTHGRWWEQLAVGRQIIAFVLSAFRAYHPRLIMTKSTFRIVQIQSRGKTLIQLNFHSMPLSIIQLSEALLFLPIQFPFFSLSRHIFRIFLLPYFYWLSQQFEVRMDDEDVALNEII